MVTYFLGLHFGFYAFHFRQNIFKVVAAGAGHGYILFLQGWPRVRPWYLKVVAAGAAMVTFYFYRVAAGAAVVTVGIVTVVAAGADVVARGHGRGTLCVRPSATAPIPRLPPSRPPILSQDGCAPCTGARAVAPSSLTPRRSPSPR